MSAGSVVALVAAIEAELEAMARQACDGFDIAPARRARVEGMAIAALSLGADGKALLAACARLLPAGASATLEEGGRALRIDIWQRRAPVEPTTRD